MKRIIVVLFLVVAISPNIQAKSEKGGLEPCLVSCCLSDPRLGYYMNQGYELQTPEYLMLGNYVIPGLSCCSNFAAGSDNGVCGIGVACCFGNRAGAEYDKYKIRTREWVGLFFYPIHILSLYEMYKGKTWKEVVKEENLRKAGYSGKRDREKPAEEDNSGSKEKGTDKKEKSESKEETDGKMDNPKFKE